MPLEARIALLVGTGAALIFGYWNLRSEPEPEPDALALLAEEWRSINCNRGTSASELQASEARTREIRAEMEAMLASQENSDAAQEMQVRIMDLIRCDPIQSEDGESSPVIDVGEESEND